MVAVAGSRSIASARSVRRQYGRRLRHWQWCSRPRQRRSGPGADGGACNGTPPSLSNDPETMDPRSVPDNTRHQQDQAGAGHQGMEHDHHHGRRFLVQPEDEQQQAADGCQGEHQQGVVE